MKTLGILLAVPLLAIIAACDREPAGPAAQGIAQKPAAAQNTAQVKLDPGCPLGANATLGIAVAEYVCKPANYTMPRGPVGTPNP